VQTAFDTKEERGKVKGWWRYWGKSMDDRGKWQRCKGWKK